MWDKIVKQWMDLAFWWVPKGDRTAAPDQEAVAPKKAEQRAKPAAGPSPASIDDDLTVIKGIGPAVQKKLRELNITTFNELSEADADTLTEKLKGSQPISVAKVRGWTEAAREQSRA